MEALIPRSSGAMNCRVPFTVDNIPRFSSIRFEMPKSAIMIVQDSGGCDLTRMFYILMFQLGAVYFEVGNLVTNP